jgi:exosortase/archaeosortase family protein
MTMARSALLQMPRFVRFGIQVDTTPEWRWLALLVAALWPTWWWMGQRMVDGSDDPLGGLALAALAAVVWLNRRVLRPAPRLAWLAGSLFGALLATAARPHVPDLLGALLALLALAAGVVAFLPSRVATAPVLGLSVLSLPLLASLQFYAGYPLRVLTAEVSTWLLALTHEVSRSGATLQVNGKLVIVDAPCSGVQMVWLGYFTACVVALYMAHERRHGPFGNRHFWQRLPAVSGLVLMGNVLRNTLLVAAQASGRPIAGWVHEAVGLMVLAAVCGGIGWVMARPVVGRATMGSTGREGGVS